MKAFGTKIVDSRWNAIHKCALDQFISSEINVCNQTNYMTRSLVIFRMLTVFNFIFILNIWAMIFKYKFIHQKA